MYLLGPGLHKGMSYPISEHAEKIDISWDGFQFICISLCRRLLKSMSDPISYHTDKSIISWDGLELLCISLSRNLLKHMSDPISDHADKLILAEPVFNFYALPCAGACCNVVFDGCLGSLVNTNSPVSLQIASVWTVVCKGALVHSAYWESA